ncbi:F0F1 ATP synthase subunit C [Ligilactobacillus saerimneri]|uniref:ATP synthase subunit c n=1 Tax=Ligilactobacillus saerimneri TaxID=228229 RepID=A0A7H9EKG9_9LACO|nr:F0F1 ATP synthase subunit C [Ligilactobacillus saerimneri]MBU5309411.1 F0F1 ATP synthase subunit C [Ligilactobacillus saerimneri]QLL78213.1 F0F1 ATP synthase subunit C [Ligilactobacillus saerimneri]
MTTSIVALLGAAIIAAVAAIATAMGNSRVISKTMESMARQPEIQNSLRTTMFIGVGLIEAVPIIAIVIAFMLLNK